MKSEEEHVAPNVTFGCANKSHLMELKCADLFHLFINVRKISNTHAGRDVL